VAGARGRDRCIEKGEIDDGTWSAGMVMGLINDIPSCEELIQTMVRDCKGTIAIRLLAML
jgi:NAD(P)H-dependent flavin oxidoreductase YrpB (nitropropane dioxygenase family)